MIYKLPGVLFIITLHLSGILTYYTVSFPDAHDFSLFLFDGYHYFAVGLWNIIIFTINIVVGIS